METRVFISSVGMLTPIGATSESCFAALLEGVTGLVFREEFKLPLGALAPEAESCVSRIQTLPHARRLDRTALMAMAAAGQAIPAADGHRTCDAGVILGTSRGPTGSLENYHADYLKNSISSPAMSPVTTVVTLSSSVAATAGYRGPVFSVSSACQSGLTALGVAFALIQAGQASRFVAGGSEACLTGFTIGALDKLRLLSHSRAHYPLRSGEADRDGTVLAEGAVLFLIEREDALTNAPLAEIVAFAQASEGGTLTSISENGEALQKCLESIFAHHGYPDLVVGHLPGTINGDQAEVNAYDRALPGDVPVTGFKWSTGHMLGASPAFSAAMALQCIHRGLVPSLPFASERNLLAARLSTNAWRRMRTALITATGFGGNASALLLRKCSN